MDPQHGRGSGENMISFEIADIELGTSGHVQNSKSCSYPSPSESARESTIVVVEDDDQSLEPKQENLELQETTLSPQVSCTNPFKTTDIEDSPSHSSEAETRENSGGQAYDPNRIPASIFARNPTIPTDWSVASNESLFSIHVGNNSFSRDHFLLLYQSGELPRSDDSSSPRMPKLQPVMEAENLGRESEATESELGNDIGKEVPHLSPDASKQVRRGEQRTLSQEKMLSSDQVRNYSNSSIVSFQYLLTEADKTADSSTKGALENQVPENDSQPEPQPRSPKTTPKAESKSWFSWFSCCSFRCCCTG